MSFIENFFSDPFHTIDQIIPDTFSVDLNGDLIPDFEWACTGDSLIPNEFRLNLDRDRFAEAILEIDVNEFGELTLVGKGDFTGDNTYDLAVAELNGDWWPDLVAINPSNISSLPSVVPTSLLGIETVLTAETGLDAWLEIEDTMLELPVDKDGGPSFYAAVENDEKGPAESASGSVLLDVESSLSHWHLQSGDDTCAICSQEFVLEELLGVEFSEKDLVAKATELGIYAPGGGTLRHNIGKLLGHFGVDFTTKQEATIPELAELLAKGCKLIVAIDSDEIWYDNAKDRWDDIFAIPGSGMDHAVQVVAIDFENNQVVLNDSGTPNGRGETIPLDRFFDAWQDSGNYVCIANRSV